MNCSWTSTVAVECEPVSQCAAFNSSSLIYIFQDHVTSIMLSQFAPLTHEPQEVTVGIGGAVQGDSDYDMMYDWGCVMWVWCTFWGDGPSTQNCLLPLVQEIKCVPWGFIFMDYFMFQPQ